MGLHSLGFRGLHSMSGGRSMECFRVCWLYLRERTAGEPHLGKSCTFSETPLLADPGASVGHSSAGMRGRV